MPVLKKFFEVILNGEQTRLEWTQSDEFNKANATKHLFGKVAMDNNLECPIKARFTFKTDGVIQSMRGDKFTGQPVEMVKNLQRLALGYIRDNKIHEVVMYDNRNLLPTNNKTILHWKQGKGTIINLLPLYSGVFDLKRKAANGKS